MMLSQLNLYHYRNYDQVDISFSKGIQLLTGKNAQGKTNILEAILYLSTTRSHRTKDDQDLIRKGSDAFFMKGMILKENRKEDIRITVNEKGKNLFIYGNPINKVSDFIGEFNAVMFCPDDMMLFNASPRVRRRFVDMELSKVSKKYTITLTKAQKLLKERNSYLKQDNVDDTFLEVVTDQLIDASVIVMKQRFFFLKKLLAKCQNFYEKLTQDDTMLDIEYISCVEFDENEEELKKRLKNRYQKSLQRDKFTKQTTHGIHKEDFIFKLNDQDLNSFASQGQKRSVLLAMKIGMVYMIEEIIHEYPVLLLDDVFSELDETRKMKLLTFLPESVQIFITTTDQLELQDIECKRDVCVYHVDHGTIQRCEGGNAHG